MAPQTGDAVSEVYGKELDLSVKEKEREEEKKHMQSTHAKSITVRTLLDIDPLPSNLPVSPPFK